MNASRQPHARTGILKRGIDTRRAGWLALGFVGAALFSRSPGLAAWFGFTLAAWSVVANDSIQTIGTFIASNRDRRWWQLWLFVGGIAVAVLATSWALHGGDITWDRLATRGFHEAPTRLTFLQLAAPVVLIGLTWLRTPVSTTLLLLSCFATDSGSLGQVVSKSLSGYVVAFGVAVGCWMLMSRWMQRSFTGPAHKGWRLAQWATTAALWSVWLMQDASNVAVYLPRQLSLLELAGAAAILFLGLGMVLRRGGDRIQEVVEEKADLFDVRVATVVDAVFAVILFVFKEMSSVPMSTTWVFIGLLAGREIAMSATATSGGRTLVFAVKLGLRDLGYVTAGFVISLLYASVANPVVRRALFP